MALVAVIVVSFMLFGSGNQPDTSEQVGIGKFNIEKYQWEIENFPLDKNIGEVNDADTAIEKAKKLWIENYGTVNDQPYDPIQGREIEVFFDNDNDCWLVKTVLPSNVKGSVPHAIIQKNGTVMAVWMG